MPKKNKFPVLHGLEKPILKTIARTLNLKFQDVSILYIRTQRNFNHTISLCKFANARGLDILKLDIPTLAGGMHVQ